jgi:hypothetical protein
MAEKELRHYDDDDMMGAVSMEDCASAIVDLVKDSLEAPLARIAALEAQLADLEQRQAALEKSADTEVIRRALAHVSD